MDEKPQAAPPPPRSPRPPGPNLRRQVMLTSSSLASSQPVGGRLELAAGLARPVTRSPAPQRPQRPARLPAAYVPLAATGATPSSSKPNRYAWAQLQHWQQVPDTGHYRATGRHHHHHFAVPFSSAASRVLVVNPMQIVNLSEHTKSRLIKSIEALKRLSEKWFSHVLLLLFLAVYACLGAYVFISFEAPSEQYEKRQIILLRERILNETTSAAAGGSGASVNGSTVSGASTNGVAVAGSGGGGGGGGGGLSQHSTDSTRETISQLLIRYEQLIQRVCSSGMNGSSLEEQWTFWGALFYSMTVFTTIGYGQLTPITFAGRCATMVYAIFGIPILLMVLADLGKLLTRIIKYSFIKFRYFYNKLIQRKESMRTRKLISENTSQWVGIARRAAHGRLEAARARLPLSRLGGLGRFGRRLPADASAAEEQPEIDGEPSAEPPVESSDVIITPASQSEPVSPELDHIPSNPGLNVGHGHDQERRPFRRQSNRRDSLEIEDHNGQEAADEQEVQEHELVDEDEEEGDEEDFDIPVSFALFLLVTYMMFGAAVFSIWEGWNFFDSLYFVFISMSTIGFGDLVPQHPKRMIGTFIYLLFGLALTSMCINVVQEKIHATFLRAKMQIGEKMGFDLDQIMADDYYDQGSLELAAAASSSRDQAAADDDSRSNSGSWHVASPGATHSSLLAEPTDPLAVESGHHEQSLIEPPPMAVPEVPEKLPAGKPHSKSKSESLKSTKPTKRHTAGLLGQHGGSLRRKHSKRGTHHTSRQTTPSASSATGHQQAAQPASNSIMLVPLKPMVETIGHFGQPQAPLIVDPPRKIQVQKQHHHHQRITGGLVTGGLCEPLHKSRALRSGQGHAPSPVSGSQRSNSTAGHQSTQNQETPRPDDQASGATSALAPTRIQVTKSLSSDLGHRPRGSGEQATPSAGLAARHGSTSGRRSADLSRRSSVSNELHELDDLIISLSKSPSQKFAPLLGIPAASARLNSRPSSPSAQCQSIGNSHPSLAPTNSSTSSGTNTSGGTNYRRATSVMAKPSGRTTSRLGDELISQPLTASLSVRESASSADRRRRALANRQSPVNLSESQKALDELESLRFSAV